MRMLYLVDNNKRRGSGIEPSGGGTTPDSGGDDEPRP